MKDFELEDLEPGENYCDSFDWVTDDMFEETETKIKNAFWETPEDETEFNFERNKKEFIENMDMLSNMSVEEATLYKKWQEWNKDLHSSMSKLPVLQSYFDTIWKPTDITNKDLTIAEITALEPYIDIPNDMNKWTNIRRLISTMEFTANPGRNLKAFVRDKITGKLLGVISLGSDITSLGVRDQFIGWTKEDKFQKGKLNNTAIATSIVATQPLGYNFLGGKLIAALTTAPEIRQYWKEKYDNILIGVGTTSLYGIHSIYNGIPHFKTLGESKGKISIKPDDKFYDVWHQWLKSEHNDWYTENITNERIRNGQSMGVDSGPVSGIKQKILTKILKELGIKADTYHHGFQRGVYMAMMYENGNQFLCDKIEEKNLILKPKFQQGNEYTIRWWKDKAIKRYSTLHAEGRLKDETLYYIDIIGMTWEECKAKYLKDVGR